MITYQNVSLRLEGGITDTITQRDTWINIKIKMQYGTHFKTDEIVKLIV